MEKLYAIARSIEKDQYYASVTVVLLSVVLLLFNMSWGSTFVGTVCSTVYFIIVSVWLARVMAVLFDLSRGWSLVFGVLVSLVLTSLLLAIPIALFRYTSGSLVSVLSIVALTSRLLQIVPTIAQYAIKEDDSELTKPPRMTYAVPKYLALLFVPVIFVAVFFLLHGRTGDFILSPWHVIPRLYVYVYILVTAIAGLFIFSKRKGAVILAVIILQSFVLHAYLPVVYETGFGGDKWRHLASERLIMTGAVYQPSLLGEDREMTTFAGVEVPAVFVSGNKTSYSQQWALTILLSEMLQIDIFYIDFWLVFILWSLFVPLLLYKIAGLIRPGRHFALFFAFIPILFYPLQVFGAITLPLSLGHIVFLFALYGWLKFLHTPRRTLGVWNVLCTLLLFFGYVLHFILLLEIGALVFLLTLQKKYHHVRFVWTGALVVFAIAAICFIPGLELLQGYGALNDAARSFGQGFSAVADAFGYLSGIVAFLPHTGHVDQGNFLFNQTRADHAPVSFLQFNLWPLFFTVLAWGLIALGFRVVKHLKHQIIPRFFMILTVVLLGNYILSWYFLDGNHILARRLDVTIVLCLSVFLNLGIFYFLEKKRYLPWATKVLLLVVMVAFVASSTYASGPLLQVVTTDEHLAAQYVWERIDKSDEYYCVLANTWPLLAVEAVSGRDIIGGGFPVGFEYSQPERVKIFETMSQFPNTDLLDWALKVTNDSSCYYMTEDKWINDRVYKETVDILGEPENIIGDVYIWQYK